MYIFVIYTYLHISVYKNVVKSNEDKWYRLRKLNRFYELLEEKHFKTLNSNTQARVLGIMGIEFIHFNSFIAVYIHIILENKSIEFIQFFYWVTKHLVLGAIILRYN